MRAGKPVLAIVAAIAASFSSVACGQVVYTPSQAPVYYNNAPPVTPQVPAFNEDQLEQLLGPIALYPDPLLGQVLPASTYPDEIADASQFVQNNPNPSQPAIDAQTWEPSVKALAHYPSVLTMMAGRLDWTAAVGTAFLNQQQDVLNAVQQLRMKAQKAGNLATTQQEQVVADSGAIDIVPVDNVVYVPTYDPVVVYTQPYSVQWGSSYVIGPWLDIDFDWAHRGLFRGHRWDGRFDVHVDRSHEQVWTRNFERPVPTVIHSSVVVPRPGVVERHDQDSHRGFVVQVTPVGAFGGVQPRDQVERERAAAAHATPPAGRPGTPVAPPTILVAPHPVAPVPAPRPAEPRPVEPRPAEPRPVAPNPIMPAHPVGPAATPAPRPVAPPPAARAPAFQPGPGKVTQQQSSRGNASLGHK